MIRKVHSNMAPKAIGSYSQAIISGNLVFTSGQRPLDKETMELVPGDIKIQTHESLKNLKFVLEESGATLTRVVKTTYYLADIKDFAAFNEVYSEYFCEDPTPARSCFEVANLPKGALVEIEAIAVSSDGR